MRDVAYQCFAPDILPSITKKLKVDVDVLKAAEIWWVQSFEVHRPPIFFGASKASIIELQRLLLFLHITLCATVPTSPSIRRKHDAAIRGNKGEHSRELHA